MQTVRRIARPLGRRCWSPSSCSGTLPITQLGACFAIAPLYGDGADPIRDVARRRGWDRYLFVGTEGVRGLDGLVSLVVTSAYVLVSDVECRPGRRSRSTLPR